MNEQDNQKPQNRVALTDGMMLSHYRIIEKIGAGGMGEVYRANDTRLDRTVAIKVLPSHVAMNDDVRARFEREAKTISSLNHPNVCTLLDVGHEDGVDFLVMEFLNGEPLDERIQRGKLETSEALEIGSQIAGALNAAHSKGLVHRDLKPSNIFLTGDGAKLLDFGLAKFETEAATRMDDETRTVPVTSAGTIIGTLQYMSPEQIEGQEADARSDIFSFGTTLYEMVTGQRAFTGDSKASLIGSIMKEEPRAISEMQPTVPATLDRLIIKCMKKNPDLRWQTMIDLKDELVWISSRDLVADVEASTGKQPRGAKRIGWVLAAFFGLSTAVLLLFQFLTSESKREAIRFSITPQIFSEGLAAVDWPRISPDGQNIAFQGKDTLGVKRIWIRNLASLESHPLMGTEEAKRHFWSPDSKHLAYFKDDQLFKIAINGGSPQLICESEGGADGTWGSSNYIIFDGLPNDTLMYVQASGGEPITIDNLDASAGEVASSWPWFLPDGVHFTYMVNDGDERVFKVGSIESNESTSIMARDELVSIESRIEYSPQGYFLYVKDNILVAHEFDVGKLELVGGPKPVAQHIDRVGNTFSFGASEDGTLLYQSADGADLSQLVFVNRNGVEIRKLTEPGRYEDVTLSPDNNYIAYGRIDGETDIEDIWIMNLRRDVVSRLTSGDSNSVTPVWSRDGKRIAYGSGLDRNRQDWSTLVKEVGRSSNPQELGLIDSFSNVPLDWTPNSRLLVLNYLDNGWDIGIVDLAANGSLTPVLTSPYHEFFGKISPDGKYVLYSSNESGRFEVYVQAIAGSNDRWQVSGDGGDMPVWSKNGKEVIYYNNDNEFVSASVSYDGGFSILTSQVLFACELKVGGPYLNRYSVTNDGERFLVNSYPDSSGISTLVLVQNWTSTIKN